MSQVKWTETGFEHGAQTSLSHWTGIVTVKVKTPTSADALRKNPLGLYVDGIDWTRELEPAAGATPALSAQPARAALPIAAQPGAGPAPTSPPVEENQQ